MHPSCLLLAFFYHSFASEDCQATSKTEGTNLLQVSGKESFCKEFYKEKDWETVSQGLQPAKLTFMEYCTSSGSRTIDCEDIAEDIFANSEGLDEKLCDNLLEAQAAYLATSRVHGSSHLQQPHYSFDSAFQAKAPPGTRTSTTPEMSDEYFRARTLTRNRISEEYYDDSTELVRIAAIRYVSTHGNVVRNGVVVSNDFEECVEMGSTSNAWQAFRDLEFYLNRDGYDTSNEREIEFGNACGPYYNTLVAHPHHWIRGSRIEFAVYRHTSGYGVDDFRNRFNPSQGREEQDSKIVVARYRQGGQSRCAEMGVAPDDSRAYDLLSEWLGTYLQEEGATQVTTQLGQSTHMRNRGYACGPRYDRFHESYFVRTPNVLGSIFYRATTGAHIVVWRSSR